MLANSKKPTLVLGLGLTAVIGGWLAISAGSLEPPGVPAPTTTGVDETDPRTPIYAVDLPKTLAAGRSYYLAESVLFSDGAITISGDGITLDLMGHLLEGNATNPCINDLGLMRWAVTVKNGIIDGCAIALGSSNSSALTDLRLRNASVTLGDGSLVDNCTATRIIEVGDGSTITDTVVANAFVSPGGILAGQGSAVIDSTSYSNSGNGITVGAGSRVSGCTVRDNGGDGISATGAATISGNTTHSNGGDEISSGGGSYILNNLVTGEGSADGNACIVATSSDNRIEGNMIRSCGTGINVTSPGNLIIKNAISGAGTAFAVVGGNDLGPVGTAAFSSSPWANIQF